MPTRWATVVSLLALAACDDFAFRDTGDYTYIAAPNLQPGLIHEFTDGPGSFAGTCEATPTFLVMDGDWDRAATRFAVTVDGRTRAFEIVPGMDTPTLALLPDGPDGSAATRPPSAPCSPMRSRRSCSESATGGAAPRPARRSRASSPPAANGARPVP